MAGKTEYKNNWQKEKVDRVNLTMPKGRKTELQEYAAQHKESLNGFINRAISETIARDGAEKTVNTSNSVAVPVSTDAENAVQAISTPVLPSEQMEQVKAHIAKTGEDTAAFINRAVDEQINRDSMAFKLGVNPAKKGGTTND